MEPVISTDDLCRYYRKAYEVKAVDILKPTGGTASVPGCSTLKRRQKLGVRRYHWKRRR